MEMKKLLEGEFEAEPETIEHYGVGLLSALSDTIANRPKTESRPRYASSPVTIVAAELEMIAKDCEETAQEAMKLSHAETTAECAEARSWLSVAHRIRHAARRIT